MTSEKIARINELAHKAKSTGLSDAEKAEQQMLRKEFIADMKANVISQLNNIDIVNEDGTVVNLGETRGKK